MMRSINESISENLGLNENTGALARLSGQGRAMSIALPAARMEEQT
jgi:hypothetical protein